MRLATSRSAANTTSSMDDEMQSDGVSTFVHATPIGPMRSCWTEVGLSSLTWIERQLGDSEPDNAKLDQAKPVAPCIAADHHSLVAVELLEDRLAEYFQSGNADFRSIPLDDRDWTPFTRSVYACCRQIAPGTTLTYQKLAFNAGNASASRAVGAAMARNRVLLVIPCHRVVSTGGKLRGFSGPGGIQTKQFLLDLEAA